MRSKMRMDADVLWCIGLVHGTRQVTCRSVWPGTAARRDVMEATSEEPIVRNNDAQRGMPGLPPNGRHAATIVDHPHHKPGSAGSQWVACHMPEARANTSGRFRPQPHLSIHHICHDGALQDSEPCNLCAIRISPQSGRLTHWLSGATVRRSESIIESDQPHCD